MDELIPNLEVNFVADAPKILLMKRKPAMLAVEDPPERKEKANTDASKEQLFEILASMNEEPDGAFVTLLKSLAAKRKHASNRDSQFKSFTQTRLASR